MTPMTTSISKTIQKNIESATQVDDFAFPNYVSCDEMEKMAKGHLRTFCLLDDNALSKMNGSKDYIPKNGQ